MFFNKVNIEDKLFLERAKLHGSKSIVDFAQSIIDDQEHTDQFTLINKLYIDTLESNRVFHIDSIKNICIYYRLPFLDRKYYKIDIPKEVQFQIDAIESTHRTVSKL